MRAQGTYPKMSADHFELLVVFGKTENRVKFSKDFYHFDLVSKVNLYAIPYQKLSIYLRKPL